MHDFCKVGLKISGNSPIVSNSLFDFETESITSVTAALTGPNLLAFLGTANGWIKKVLISGPDPGEYESIEIDPGNAILSDTMMSPKQDFLYALSKQKVSVHFSNKSFSTNMNFTRMQFAKIHKKSLFLFSWNFR